ncbi:MAG: FAD-dependent oxidoreductase [Lachnospiraceae bacterium]|nr:FAD-dependent oxidoreductase [Lachnospiraceae bacterium]
MTYERLLEPITIRNLTLDNRMVITAMLTRLAGTDGSVTDEIASYFWARAEGGWGMQICENLAVRPDGKAYPRVWGAWSDDQVPALKKVVDGYHERGGKIVGQIYHAGRAAVSAYIGYPSVGPSAIMDPTVPQHPHELTTDEVKELVKCFADAARRVKEAGFDGVEIHGGHGYLISAFLSPYSNKRTDEYGGNLRRRAKFALDIVKAVREEVGDFPIFFRISAREYVNGGLDIGETKAIAKMLEEAGIDCLNVSHSIFKRGELQLASYNIPKAKFVSNAAEMKAILNIPVITVGRINDPDIAEEVLDSGAADMVAMARASLADPQLANKVKRGDYEGINKCIGCLQGCVAGANISCLVNPETGYERTHKIIPVEKPGKVFIAGGGICGCEAAIVAAKRGHKVTLFEESACLGGQWLAASVPVNKGDFSSLIVWQKNQLDILGVDIKLNTELSAEHVKNEAPDAVIIATGSKENVPPIPGLKESNFALAQEFLLGRVPFGKNIVVIGGGAVGAEVADHIAEHNTKATIVEMLPEIAPDELPSRRIPLLARLAENKVPIYTNTTVEIIEGTEITIKTSDGVKVLSDVDQIVVSTGSKSYNPLSDALAQLECKVIVAGDAKKVANGMSAMNSGYEAGMNV